MRSRFAFIVGGTKWNSITYVDCFSGPWNTQSEKFEDSSFSIALDELRKARDSLKKRGLELKLRCFFIEKSKSAYTRLERFAKETTDAEIATRNSGFEKAIPDILEFIKAGGRRNFAFIFIDPTGWTGFAMKTIQPLLKVQPGEVLINFMTRHIRRFYESPQEAHRESFEQLFGKGEMPVEVSGLSKEDRDDALVRAYMRNVKKSGGFNHVCTAIVLSPLEDSAHFHLIYATRDPKGVEVFKAAEKRAMEEMKGLRAEAQKRKRTERDQQDELSLFGPGDDPMPLHFKQLRDRYLSKVKAATRQRLEKRGTVPYDDAWTYALAAPLIWDQDFKQWLNEWQKEGLLSIPELKPPKRVPKLGVGMTLVWQSRVRPPSDED